MHEFKKGDIVTCYKDYSDWIGKKLQFIKYHQLQWSDCELKLLEKVDGHENWIPGHTVNFKSETLKLFKNRIHHFPSWL